MFTLINIGRRVTIEEMVNDQCVGISTPYSSAETLNHQQYRIRKVDTENADSGSEGRQL